MSGTQNQAKAGESGKVTVSEPDPYGAEPPRLIAAIDDTKTDFPQGTKLVDYLSARAKADAARAKAPQGAKYPSKVGTAMAGAEVPWGHVVQVEEVPWTPPAALKKEDWIKDAPKKKGHELVNEILTWVAGRLEKGFEKVWESQEGPSTRWWTPTPPNQVAEGVDPKDEEAWARITTELCLGITYAGPGDSYDMGSAGRKTPPSGRWDTYIYQRLEQGYPVEACWTEASGEGVLHGAYHVPSWKSPYPVSKETKLVKYKDQAELEAATKDFWTWQKNDDPASPVVAACQHLTTIVAMMRGYPLSWMGGATAGAVGYQASDAVVNYPIFGVEIAPAGLSPYGAAKPLIEANVGLPKGGKFYPASRDLLPSIVKADGSTPAGVTWKTLGDKAVIPGTIFVWDPDQGFAGGVAYDQDGASTEGAVAFESKKQPLTIYMTEFEKVFRERATFAMFFRTRQSAGGAAFGGAEYLKPGARAVEPPDDQQILSAEKQTAAQLAYFEKEVQKQKGKVDALPANAWNRKQEEDKLKKVTSQHTMWKDVANRFHAIVADLTPRVGVVYVPQQLPGSHITVVLRTTPDRTALQLLDTGFGGHLGVLAQTGSEAIVPMGGAFITDGYRHPKLGEGASDPKAMSQEASGLQIGEGNGKTFAGMGVPAPLPASRTLKSQIEHLKKCRPVGLMRLALTLRPAGYYYFPKDQVLFVSPLRMMYGTKDTENYPVSKLLWSLRNTPAFTNVQPWWLIYIPRGLLARSMYAHGAREMTLDKFVEHFRNQRSGADMNVVRYLQRYGTDTWPPKDPEKAIKAAEAGKLYNNRHYMMVVIGTNHGSEQPAFAGKAQYFRRYKYSEGNTGQAGEGGVQPGSLVACADALSWDEMYVHPKLDKQALAAGLPSFFKATSLPPLPEPDPYD